MNAKLIFWVVAIGLGLLVVWWFMKQTDKALLAPKGLEMAASGNTRHTVIA